LSQNRIGIEHLQYLDILVKDKELAKDIINALGGINKDELYGIDLPTSGEIS